MLNERHEEILESVWKVAEDGSHSLETIAKKCVVDFSDEDIAFLSKHGFIEVQGEEIHLSPVGSDIAEGLVRRHRIAEVLLSSMLKLRTEEMERIACEVEHSLIPEVEEAICTLLGHPEHCPDGHPIPPGTCCKKGEKTIATTVESLAELAPGEKGKVTYIKYGGNPSLEKLMSIGLAPGTVVRVLQKKPVYCITFENTELALDKEILENIFVWKLTPESVN